MPDVSTAVNSLKMIENGSDYKIRAAKLIFNDTVTEYITSRKADGIQEPLWLQVKPVNMIG